jgi:hypothetical protein
MTTLHHVDPSTEQRLSIWFFVGVLTLASGAIILGQGIYEFWYPGTTVLANLHPAFWWGLLMTSFGLFYTIRFRPDDWASAVQMESPFKNSPLSGDMFIGTGVIAAVFGFFLPIVSLSVPDKAAQAIDFLPSFLGQSAGEHTTDASISLFDVTKLWGVVYFVLLLAIASAVLFYFSKKAATPQRLLISGFQVAIGSLIGPGTIVALFFVPEIRSVAGIGYLMLGLGFCSITAGGLITISTLGKELR